MNIRYKFRGAPTSRKDTFFEGRKILVHPIISYIYSNYGFNPNPRRLHKRDTSASILYRLPSTVNRYPDFKQTFYESMRMSFQQIKKVLESVDITLKTNCGKVLVNSLYFRCLDCEVQSETSMATVYCPDCFSHSRHEGHRVISKISGDNPMNCNCGDPIIIKEEGFCPNHGMTSEEEIREAVRGFPETLKENFFAVMANVFYALFTLCEEFLKRTGDEKKEDSSFGLDQLMEDIIAVVKELYKINPHFKLVISRFLMMTPEEFPQSNMLCHNCHNLSRNEIIGSRRVCECTYLTNILRYHSLFSRELNIYLMSFLAELLVDTKFKLFFSDCYTRYIHYLFPVDETGTHDCYGLEGLVTQAYTGENNCRVILENNMNIVISIIEEMIEKIPIRYEDVKNQHITTIYGLMNFIHYLPEKKWAGRALYEGTNVIERLLQAVCSLQGKHVQYIIEYSPPFVLDGWNYNVGAFSRELELDAHIFKTLNAVFTSASLKSFEVKQSILQAYNICMLQFLKEKDELKSERKKSIDYTGDTSITLHQMAQRLFIILLAQSLSTKNQSISLDNITSFVEKTLVHPEKSISNITSIFVKESLKCIGALSYLTLATTVDNFSVSYHYYLPSSPFYYCDILSLQIFANYIPTDKLFKTFWKYFFVLDDSTVTAFQYFFETNWEHVDINDVRRIRSFLEFLAHFLNTELPLLNSFSSMAKVKADQFNRSLNSIHAKSLALLLQKYCNQYIDVQTIKTTADLVLSDHLNHTDRLSEICEIEKKTGKIKLKTEYKQMRQSYYFPDSRVENDVAQSFMENFPEKDVIDSYEFKVDFDVLIGLREKFFEGELAVWLVRFFMEFKEDWIDFLPHAMKLTLIGLELLKGRSCVGKKCERNLKVLFVQNGELVKKLEEIEKQLVHKGAGSLTLTFKRIREVIGQCSDAEKDSKIKEEAEKSKEDDEAERKRKMRQRQLEIQKQFQMKQANFVQHMKPETQKVFVEEKKKDEEANKENQESHMCHFCRERIDLEGNDYGVPIYVGKCNINFSEKEVKSQDSLLESVYDNTGSQFYHLHDLGRTRSGRSRSCFSPAKKLGSGRNDIIKIKHYPFITSCMHMAHIKCHDNYIRDIDDEEAYFFCAYCKSTYNCLLTKSITKTIKDTRKATVKLNDSQRVPLPFTKTFLKAAGVMPSPSGSISLNQLSYLIHLLLTGFLQVTKNKSLYDLESFMAKRYLPYKLLFENMTRFMKDYSKYFKVDLGDTIFSLFYKTIYELDSKSDTSFGEGCVMNTPPNKTPRSLRTGVIVPNGASLNNKKGKPGVYPKSEISLEGSSYRSPIKTFVYQEKGLNSNCILHQLQNSRTKALYNRTKLGSAIYKVNKKTIPEKKLEAQIDKEMSPIYFSLQSLEPSESEINSIKQQLSCLLKEELEEALQRETIKAMKSRASEVEMKRILGYGVFLGSLQVLMKVLCAFDEEIEVGSYQEIMDQVMGSELLYINFKDELVIFLERMLTISFMTFNIKEAYTLTARIQEIVSSSNDEEKYIDVLLSVFDPEINLKCLLSDKIINKLRIEDAFIMAWQRILSETLASDTAKEKAQSLNTLSHPQLVIEMPDDYLEFNNEYVCKKCDLCRNLSANNHSAICLQCGATFCLSPCSAKNPWGDNLCDHANTEHKGECIGLCVQTCEIILVCSKFKTFLKESLYMDKFGQSPAEIDLEGQNVEWKEVKLKKELMGQLTGWISNHKIVQQIGFEIQKYHMA